MPTLSNQNIVLTQDLLHVPSDHLLDRGRLCYDQLKTVLQFHEHRYYILNDPLISDFEYDQLYKKLEYIEEKQPEWVTSDSPTISRGKIKRIPKTAIKIPTVKKIVFQK